MSKVAKVGPRGENIQEELPEEETNCAMLANLFVSQGKSGKVSLSIIFLYNNTR